MNEEQPITAADMEAYRQHEGVLAQTKRKRFACDYPSCGRSFDSPQGLSMHKVRVHTHRFGRNPMKTREQILQGKRDYNKRLRQRNIAMGLTSSGQPRKMPLRKSPAKVPPYKSKAYKRKSYLKQAARFRAMGLTTQGRIPVRAKRNALLNGVAEPQPETDAMGESARAIIVAAQVLRSVSLGLKL